MRKPWRLFSILFSLVLLLPTSTSTHACWFGPEDEELRYMVFNPDLMENKAWWSFFYNNKLNYLDGAVGSSDDEYALANEWIQKLNGPDALPAAYDCFFGSPSDSALDANSFYAHLKQQPKALAYFNEARACENLLMIYDGWNRDEQKNQELFRQRAGKLEILNDALEAETDVFYKKKYAFQVLRLAYYNQDSVTVSRIYSNYFDNSNSKSVLDWWAANYKSVMLDQVGKFDSANYLHALVFSHSSNKMFVSKQYFSNKDLKAVLALAKDDSERADVWVLSEVINPGRALEGLQKIQAYNPAHRHFPLLIGREINKLEDWLKPNLDDAYPNSAVRSNLESDYQYLSAFTDFVLQHATLEQRYPEFYHLALAYLFLMNNQAAEARSHLHLVNPTNPQVAYQVKALELLAVSLEEDIATQATQEKLGKMFNVLLKDRGGKFESQKLLYSLSGYFRHAYAKKGMAHLAGLFDYMAVDAFCISCSSESFEYSMVNYFDRYTTPRDVEKLIRLYQQPVKNSLEILLLRPYTNVNYFYDVLATQYLRVGDTKKALAALEKVPDDFWFTFSNAMMNVDRDPFQDNAELLDIQTLVSYNKREIVGRMVRLEAEAERRADVRAENYLQLGNAWFNFTANSWFMINYGWSSEERDLPVYRMAKNRALVYYKKALLYEKAPERRAKLLYMAALLTTDEPRRTYAREYERLSSTTFYSRRNCLTLKDLGGAN